MYKNNKKSTEKNNVCDKYNEHTNAFLILFVFSKIQFFSFAEICSSFTTKYQSFNDNVVYTTRACIFSIPSFLKELGTDVTAFCLTY
jgi:hypothetical protein